MFVKNLLKCRKFKAGDDTVLRELIHPDKQKVKLRYSLAHAELGAGKTSYPHSLKTSEVYYILKGKGLMHINGQRKTVGPGDAVYIPPNAKQYIKNTCRGGLVFICIVDPAWRKRDEKIWERH